MLAISVLPLSRESTVGTPEDTVFREIKNVIPFHAHLNIIRIFFKIFLMISLFTFLLKGE